MSAHLAPSSALRIAAARARLAALAALLAAEAVALTVRFDTASLGPGRRWWAAALENLRVAPQLAVAAGAATLLLGGARLRDRWALARGRTDAPRRVWPLLAGQLVAFAGFAAATVVVLEGDLDSRAHPEAWLALWAAAGLVTFALWAACLLPASSLLSLLRHGAGAVLAGAVVGAAGWYAGELTDRLWRPLGRSTLWVAFGLLRLACPGATCRPADFTLATPSFEVTIAPSCSGYEGIGLVLVFVAAYLWWSRRDLRFPHALLLLPLGAATIWLANAARIAALVALGTYASAEVAEGGFHSQAGWLAFNAVALGLVAASRRSRLFAAAGAPAGPAREANPTAAYLGPLMAIVAATMVGGAFSAGVDWLYPLRIPAAALALALGWPRYNDLRRTWSWGAVAIGAAAFALWMALEPPAAGSPTGAALARGLAGLPRGAAMTWLAARVVGSVVTVPLAEELAFRGYLTRRLIAVDFQEIPPGQFTWPSLLISSALFGVLHGRWLAGMAVGLLYAIALYRRRQLTDAVLAHATTNALIAGYVLATGSWSLWT